MAKDLRSVTVPAGPSYTVLLDCSGPSAPDGAASPQVFEIYTESGELQIQLSHIHDFANASDYKTVRPADGKLQFTAKSEFGGRMLKIQARGANSVAAVVSGGITGA